MNLALSGLRLTHAGFTLSLDGALTGRVTAVFGASGAGKTSLLELIAGLRRPAEGVIRLDSTVLTDIAAGIWVRAEHRAVGYVPQEGALFPHLSVRQNLLYGHRVGTAASTSLTLEHVTAVLEIAALLDRAPATLSGGEKQRVALGRALLAAPRLLLLDEPLAGLDAPLRARLLPYLARVRDEFALPMLYVTHAADEVMALADEVLVLDRGRSVAQGRPATLFAPSAQPHYTLRPDLL